MSSLHFSPLEVILSKTNSIKNTLLKWFSNAENSRFEDLFPFQVVISDNYIPYLNLD